ncbi:MAG TPA: molybdenum cofactor biosynthesis protein MoaE [Flavobacteriales bacterium]|nr:molybdenum cofactor biosynthesis protein MoaE [Flavobacteriales bacterium]
MSTAKKTKNIFIDGPITPERIATSIAHHQAKTDIGAHDIFLGQVRADTIEGKVVAAIDYSAHADMANAVMDAIREDTFTNYPITCMHVFHSLGTVKAGELCLFVFTSSAHRSTCMDATRYVVERIKKELPVFGKELFPDSTHVWKQNN